MLYFKDFSLTSDSEFLAMQFDNETRRLEVFGDFPTDWSWEMMVTVGDNHDILPLEPFDGGVGRNLTRDNLSIDGLYDLQLRGTYGEKVQHTNQITVQVFSSQSGDANWPEIPTSFSDAEERIKEYNDHPPKPGDNGFWLTWNVETNQYEESDIPLPDVSVGPQGPAGPEGPPGPTGTTPQISVTVTTLPAGQDVTVQVSGPAEAPTIAFGIPQGEPGERGPQGLQGFQGWGLSAAELDEDGALVLTIRNPADGKTQTLPPVPIDNSAALQAVAAAITAQGTTQVQRVEEAGDDAVGAVSTAKDAALEAVGQAQTTATGAVASAQTTAVQAVQDAQGTATTAISQAQSAAVGAVEGAKTDALESVGALVQQAEDAAIRQPIISDTGTWMIWDANTGQYRDTGIYAGGQAPYIGADGYWYVGNVKTDTLARGPKGDPGEGVPSTDGVPTDYLLSPAGWVAPPSGGGENWELIIDHVVPETVASVLIDQDLNGKAFSLKKWALLTIWLPDENVSTQERCQVGFHPSTIWGNGAVYETAKAPTNAEIASCTLAFCSFTNGLIKLDDIYWPGNYTNIAYEPNRQYQGLNQSGGFNIDSSTKEIVSTYRDSYATCVKINTISRTAVRKGSVIRLWGVRA